MDTENLRTIGLFVCTDGVSSGISLTGEASNGIALTDVVSNGVARADVVSSGRVARADVVSSGRVARADGAIHFSLVGSDDCYQTWVGGGRSDLVQRWVGNRGRVVTRIDCGVD